MANLKCTALDYLARQKVHGNHLAWYLIEPLLVIPPAACRIIILAALERL
jgi:hypothetical protein